MENLNPVQEFEQLLPIEYTRGLETREILAFKIKKSKVSEFVEYSKKNKLLDPDEFDHLKLVNGSPEDPTHTTVLLCTKEVSYILL